jgi:hypothetical protein
MTASRLAGANQYASACYRCRARTPPGGRPGLDRHRGRGEAPGHHGPGVPPGGESNSTEVTGRIGSPVIFSAQVFPPSSDRHTWPLPGVPSPVSVMVTQIRPDGSTLMARA